MHLEQVLAVMRKVMGRGSNRESAYPGSDERVGEVVGRLLDGKVAAGAVDRAQHEGYRARVGEKTRQPKLTCVAVLKSIKNGE